MRPCSLAAAKPARVRSTISSLSISASALMTTSYRRLLRLRNEKINGGDLLIMTTPYTTPRSMYRLVVPDVYSSDEEFIALSDLVTLLKTK